MNTTNINHAGSSSANLTTRNITNGNPTALTNSGSNTEKKSRPAGIDIESYFNPKEAVVDKKIKCVDKHEYNLWGNTYTPQRHDLKPLAEQVTLPANSKEFHSPDGSIFRGEKDANNQFKGNGELCLADGSYYKGGWRQSKFDGFGVYCTPKGDYAGFWQNNQKHGKGIEVSEIGDVYRGNFVNGKKQGEGHMQWVDLEEYNGEWHNDQRHGIGTMKYPNGDTYVGLWHENVRAGKASYSYANGDSYEGEWLHHGPHGYGTLKSADGTTKTGYWKHGLFHGKGVLEDKSTGSIFDGIWVEGKPSGFGTLMLADGRSFSGKWQNLTLISEASITYPSQLQVQDSAREPAHDIYTGSICGLKREGWGKMRYANGGSYSGEWHNDLYHGNGERDYGNGTKFIGQFENGQRSGNGRLVEDGIIISATWENDARVGEAELILSHNIKYPLVNDLPRFKPINSASELINLHSALGKIFAKITTIPPELQKNYQQFLHSIIRHLVSENKPLMQEGFLNLSGDLSLIDTNVDFCKETIRNKLNFLFQTFRLMFLLKENWPYQLCQTLEQKLLALRQQQCFFALNLTTQVKNLEWTIIISKAQYEFLKHGSEIIKSFNQLLEHPSAKVVISPQTQLRVATTNGTTIKINLQIPLSQSNPLTLPLHDQPLLLIKHPTLANSPVRNYDLITLSSFIAMLKENNLVHPGAAGDPILKNEISYGEGLLKLSEALVNSLNGDTTNQVKLEQ